MQRIDPSLATAAALFNAGAYFEAHEHMEAEWLRAPAGERFFLQALIHMAVAWHHATGGNGEGAQRQVDKGLRKLAGYLPCHAGIDTAALYQDAQRWQDEWRTGQPASGRATIGLKR